MVETGSRVALRPAASLPGMTRFIALKLRISREYYRGEFQTGRFMSYRFWLASAAAAALFIPLSASACTGILYRRACRQRGHADRPELPDRRRDGLDAEGHGDGRQGQCASRSRRARDCRRQARLPGRSWIPYLTIKFTLTKDGDAKFKKTGLLFPMTAKDGTALRQQCRHGGATATII